MTIALDALGETYMRIAAEQGINPASMRCCGWPQLAPVPSTACRIMCCHDAPRRLWFDASRNYLDIVMVGIVSALIALVAVIALGSMLPSSKMMELQVRSRCIRGTSQLHRGSLPQHHRGQRVSIMRAKVFRYVKIVGDCSAWPC